MASTQPLRSFPRDVRDCIARFPGDMTLCGRCRSILCNRMGLLRRVGLVGRTCLIRRIWRSLDELKW